MRHSLLRRSLIATLALLATAAHAADDKLLAAARSAQPAVIESLREMVLIESGSQDGTGLKRMADYVDSRLRALGASKLDIMRKVGIPRSLPYFFGSLKVAITLAFVGTVVSESVASNNGIGNLMLQAQAQFNVPLIFAGLLALAVLGIVMYWVMAVLEQRMTGWAQRSGFAQN